MGIKRILSWFFMSALFCGIAHATSTNIYSFSTPLQQTRFEQLIQQFRCLVCQNETLADSNAPLAKDLRGQIANLIQEGHSNAEIRYYLIQRYGDYILFRPRLTALTYLLWFGPFALLIVGLCVLLMVVRKRQHLLREEA